MSDPTVRLDQRHHAEAVEAATDGIPPPHPELRRLEPLDNGPFTEDGSRYEVTVGDGVLTGVGPARFQYALDDDGRIAVNVEGTIAVAWWIRDEAGEWEPWMTNVHPDQLTLLSSTCNARPAISDRFVVGWRWW